jgi:PAS domain S-box-containing protein
MYAEGLFSPRMMDFNDPDIRLSPPVPPGPEVQEPFSDMFRLSPEAIVIFDPGASGGMLNPRASEILGYSGEELTGVPFSGLVSPPSYRQALRALSGLRRRKKVSGELELLKKSGRVIPAYFSAAPLGAGRAVLILRDISAERRRAEELQDERERTSALAEASPVPQVVFSGKKLVHANAAFRKSFSWVNSSPGEVTLKEFLGKENGPLLRELSGADSASAETAGLVHEQVVIKTPEGERREYALTATRTGWNGKAGVYLTLSDVTSQSEALHTLRESERTFRELCERQAGAVSVHRDGTFVYANAACAALFGVSFAADLTGKELTNFAAQRDRKALASVLGPGDRKSGGELEYTIKRPDGSTKTVASAVTGIEFEGSPALLVSHRDLSGERRAEEELRRQARGEAILESLAHRIHLSLDPAEVLSEALRSAMKWLGFESGGAYRAGEDGTTLTLFVNESLDQRVAETLASQNTREGVTGMVWKTAEPLLLDVNDYPAHIPYKSLFASSGVHSVLYLPLISGETVRGILLLCSSKEPGAPASDAVLCAAIARHAGDALANALRYESTGSSERTYRTAVESITDVVYECTPDGRFVFLSPRVAKLTGYLPEEIIRAPDLWRTLLHPDDRGDYSRRISNQAEGKEEFELEYRLLPKGKASYRPLRDSVRYGRDDSGKVTRIHGIVSDVSTRAARTAAEAEGAKLREDVFQSFQEGIIVLDSDLRYSEWNKGMELISGFRREDVIGKNVFDAGPRFQLADFAALLNTALAGTPVSSEEIRYVRPGGEDISVLWCRFSPLRDPAGTIGGVVGTVTDVTHRKSLERELKESEETLRNVIDTMGDALMISDLQGKVWEVNREFSALTGHPRSEVIGLMFPYPWLIEEEMSRLVVWLAALREKRFLRDFDMTWKKHGGGR